MASKAIILAIKGDLQFPGLLSHFLPHEPGQVEAFFFTQNNERFGDKMVNVPSVIFFLEASSNLGLIYSPKTLFPIQPISDFKSMGRFHALFSPFKIDKAAS